MTRLPQRGIQWTATLLGIAVVAGGLAMSGTFQHDLLDGTTSLSLFGPVIRTHVSAAFSNVSSGVAPAIGVSTGDSILVFVAQYGDNGTPLVGDSLGDSYTEKDRASKALTVTTTIYEVDNVQASAALAVTVTFQAHRTFAVGVVGVEAAGVSPIDAIGTPVYGAEGSYAQPTVTTSAMNDVVLGVIADDENHSVSGAKSASTMNSSTAISGTSVITLGVVSEPDAGTGSFTVWGSMGPARTVLSLSYGVALKPVVGTAQYSVTFSAFGLPTGTNWSVALDGVFVSAKMPTPLSFSEPNGSYSYSVGIVNGYFATPSSGTVKVAGANVSAGQINFTAVATPGKHFIDHVVVIVLENANASQVNPVTAPYESYLAGHFSRATQYYSMCHPSLADYLALGSGYNNCILGGNTSGEGNVADLLEANGLTWMDYSESLPANCSTTSSGLYDTDHNPFLWFPDIAGNRTRCDAHLVSSSVFNASVASGTLGNFSFYAPNNIDDGHNTGVAAADAWLKGFLPPILNHTGPYNSTAEQSLVAHTAFFVVWDEANNSDLRGYLADGLRNAYCVETADADLSACGGLVYMVAISPYSLGLMYSLNATHISLLSTIEWLFSLPGDGGWDGSQYFPAMTGLFSFASNGFNHPE